METLSRAGIATRRDTMGAQFSQTTRSLANETSRFAHLAWIAAGVLFAGWLVWLFFGSVTVYELSKSARVEVRSAPHRVGALVAGKVVSTSLLIGREVRAGDVLVELDASGEKFSLAEEAARLAAMPARIASLRREVEAREHLQRDDRNSAVATVEVSKQKVREADAAVELAQSTEARLTKLNSGGWASTVDTQRAANDTVRLSASRDSIASDLRRIEFDGEARVHMHEAEIESLKRSIVQLESDTAVSRATIERLRVEIEKHLVRAPINGRIGDLLQLSTGAYVAEGQQLATVVPADDLIVVAEFSPSLTLGRVRPGQKAQLRLDAFPWAQFGSVPATVTRVASEIRDNLVRVELTPDAMPAGGIVMQHGLLGAVEVSVEHASPAALVLRAGGLLLASRKGSDAPVAEAAR
jgi:membrane fusion protein (multidrug efflux system)